MSLRGRGVTPDEESYSVNDALDKSVDQRSVDFNTTLP
jgi:hypothetical protein